MSVAFGVTAYQEMKPSREYGGRLLRSIRAAQADSRIDEIVIVDDGSDDYVGLETVLDKEAKVHLFRNHENLGVWGNKIEVVARSTCDWVISCDSDNSMTSEYFDIVDMTMDPDVRYSPSFARPEFDYRGMVGQFSLGNIATIIDMPLFECVMNTGNLVTHRETFMEVFGRFRGKPMCTTLPNFLGVRRDLLKSDFGKWEAVYNACDSFMFQLLWLLEGKAVEIVSGLEYDHYYTNSDDSNYARAPAEKCDLSRAMKTYLKKVVG